MGGGGADVPEVSLGKRNSMIWSKGRVEEQFWVTSEFVAVEGSPSPIRRCGGRSGRPVSLKPSARLGVTRPVPSKGGKVL
jgi:hypothetical protein